MQPYGPSSEPIDLVCQSAASAERLAGKLAVVAVVALLLSWLFRHRAASAGQGGAWAIACLLVGSIHVLVALALVPSGCLTSSMASTVLATAAPWVFAAALLNFAIAPVAPSLRRDDDDVFEDHQ